MLEFFVEHMAEIQLKLAETKSEYIKKKFIENNLKSSRAEASTPKEVAGSNAQPVFPPLILSSFLPA